MGEDFVNQINCKERATIRNEGLKLTIIDFTLSRLTTEDGIQFNPFNDNDLFTGKGDYQFEVYRMMKAARPSNDWSCYNPQTNIMVTLKHCMLTSVVLLLDREVLDTKVRP